MSGILERRLLKPVLGLFEKNLARLCLVGLGLFSSHSRRFLAKIDSYDAWMELNEIGPGARVDLSTELSRHNFLPLISVVMPVYRPNHSHFIAAIKSIDQQIYSNWELCLCDDGNEDAVIQDELRRLSIQSSKTNLATHLRNQGIAAAMNSAAKLARGEIMLFLDQDDLLAPDCLAEFALAFARGPDVDLVYSDSDKLDAQNRRTSPSFKPGWSPWLLLTHMYMSHAVAMRRSLFERVGGFAQGLDGSQDYDLILRASEMARKINHIPRVLYHWRAELGSTALGANEKPGSITAGKTAVERAFSRRKIEGIVIQPKWAQKAQIGLFQPLFYKAVRSVSFILLVQENDRVDEKFFDFVSQDIPTGAQVVVVCPACLDREEYSFVGPFETAAWLPSTGSLGDDFQLALRHITGEVIVCLLACARPTKRGWLQQLCGYALASKALVASRVVAPKGKLFAVGLVKPRELREPERAFFGLSRKRHGATYLARTTHEVLSVTGECLAFTQQLMKNLVEVESGASTALALGQQLSAKIRGDGGEVLVCGEVEVEIANATVDHARPSTATDSWYNPNLGCGRQQFRPRCISPEVRQPEPVSIAVVTHNLDCEGAQSTLFDLVEGLVTAGHARPLVVSTRSGPLGSNLERMGIPIKIIPSPAKKASRKAVLEYRTDLAQTYRRAGVQAVLANTLESYCAIGAATDAGLASVWWQHEGGHWSRYFKHLPFWRKAMAFSAFGAAYRVVQVAESTRRNWLPIATRDNFEVIRHGIPDQRLNADFRRQSKSVARAALGIGDNDLCIVLLGSVSRRKSQGEAIRALKHLPEAKIQRLRLLIVGAFVDASYHAELLALLASLPAPHLASVELTGAVPDASIYLAAADLFLCCSRRESAPRAIMEAMSFGLPVITTPVDGIPELVQDGQNGLFYRPGDLKGLARTIQQLMDSHSLRDQLGTNAKSWAADSNGFDAMVERFGKLLREAAWQRRDGVLGGCLEFKC